MTLAFHPLKSVLHQELQNRQFPQILGNVVLTHLTVLHKGDKQSQQQHLQDIASRHNVQGPDADSSCYYQDFGEIDIRWEYHTEFSSYTFIRFNTGEDLLTCPPWEKLPCDWKQSIPGDVIAAVHMDTQDLVSAEKIQQQLAPESTEFTQCRVYASSAELFCSQIPDKDGFEQVVLNRRGTCLTQTGRIIRSVLELFSYRMMGLLALPTCKQLLPDISIMEQQLAMISVQLSSVKQESNLKKESDLKQEPDPKRKPGHEKNHKSPPQREILHSLSQLSAKLEAMIANHQFRLDAAMAYFQIVENRLNELKEKPLDPTPTLQEYLQRRLIPAKSTCQSIKDRMLNLSERIDKASDLMRTQITLEVEIQNQSIFQAIEKRTTAQFRMQQLVESVSIVAVSYYLVQLLSYMIIIPQTFENHINKELVIASSVPVTLGAVWLCFRQLRRMFNR